MTTLSSPPDRRAPAAGLAAASEPAPDGASTGAVFSILTGRTVSRLIYEDVPGCMAVVRDAYLAHARGLTVNPSSVFLRFPSNPTARIIALPAHLEHPWNVSGIKWIASYPENVAKGIPRASAILVLNRTDDGRPFVCMEASIVSAARTAASAALAAQVLSATGRRARTLAIVGAGLISRHIHRFLVADGWHIDAVRVYDINETAGKALAAEIRAQHVHSNVEATADLATAVRDAEVVVFATIAATPHVFDGTLLDHRPLVLHISLRDLSAHLIRDSMNVVDDLNHVMQADTSPHLAKKLTGGTEFVAGTLADVIEGRCTPDPTRTVIFSPFGLGVLDVAVGNWVYERAAKEGLLVAVPDFFGNIEGP
jgi:ornithine cyclodeaminase